MSIAYIALGSNLGNKHDNLQSAINKLEEKNICVMKKSSFLETLPYGITDQPIFLNAVIQIETKLAPEELLKLLLDTELLMGRERKRHWGERNIDLDLLLYDDLIYNSERLNLPHPDMQNRFFVLQPLSEIAPNLIHPILKKNIKSLLSSL